MAPASPPPPQLFEKKKRKTKETIYTFSNLQASGGKSATIAAGKGQFRQLKTVWNIAPFRDNEYRKVLNSRKEKTDKLLK